MNRERLPNRRRHLVFEIEHGGQCYTAGVGHFADGRPAELFLTAAKVGTAADANARDAAVLLSLALQHGCPIETARHAILRNADGSPAGPIGAVLDAIGA